MLTGKDFDKLVEIFPTKEDVRRIVQEEIEPFKKETLIGLDRLGSAIETQDLPNAARDAQLSRHDAWIHQVADDNVKLKED